MLRRLSSVFCLLALSVGLRAETVVFQGGKALLPVSVAADAAAEERAAGEELARVLGVMAGTEWPVLTESARGGAGLWGGRTAPAALYVGHTQRSAELLPALRPARDVLAPTADEIGRDGFRVRTLHGSVFIEGATPEATAFAVAWLLQHEAGVRWYLPGPLGEVIPRRESLTLRDLAVAIEPGYVSREISGLVGAAGQEWARRNGLRRRLEYSHNLVNLFTPEIFDAHPEWYAEVNGVRRRPLGGGEYHWQPDLSRVDVAEYAAERAAEALAKEPARASFALGMNDTVRFDQGPGTRALVEPLRYFRGMPDYAPLIMTFMNRAAEALQRKPGMENRYLGCLAYFWAENPPPFAMNAHVLPYVTTDRTQFYDSAYRAADYALMSRWGRSGVRAFGLWEYAEGNAYVVPRSAHGAIAEAIHEGWWRGARGYMGECGPNLGFDGFKIWMMAQLQWDPNRPLAELEDDFFNGFYGPAAEPMRRFFQRCEAQWMAQAGPPWWIKFYQQPDQLLLFPPQVCTELRLLLNEAERSIAECGTGKSGTQEVRNGTVAGGGDPGMRTDECGNQGIRNGGRRTEGGRQKITKGTKTEDGGQTAEDGWRNADSNRDECGNQEIRNGTVAGGGDPGDPDRPRRGRLQTETLTRSAPAAAIGNRQLSERAEQAQPLQPETRNPKRGTDAGAYAARVALTSRAFAVTAAAVAFDGIRRELLAPKAEGLRAVELGQRLVALQRARTRLESAVREATSGETPAMSMNTIEYLLRPDPVPRLLTMLGRQERAAPLVALAELTLAGEAVPAHWKALATALATQAVSSAPNLLANPRFAAADVRGQEPRFLYPLSGAIPAGWELRAAPTEKGRVALGPLFAGMRALRIEGAWDTQLQQVQAVKAGVLYVAEVQMRGKSSPGNDAALTLAFLDAGGRLMGEYRTVMLPKGESGWRTLVLADTAPAGASYVVVGLSAMRQFGGDWLEAAAIALRAIQTTEDR